MKNKSSGMPGTMSGPKRCRVCPGGQEMDLEKVATAKKGRSATGRLYGQTMSVKPRYKDGM